ncbi:hypothetical protein Y1Q_0004997 [Alligator mississippiensis]|uniref:Uncharacterized protein n=1 Tax=Alligator mississippiensis TaxID=8496 RepID=A0A151LZF7_ALLMI|nr:hypothetical protein Y1Q_0004997 [Alligator mississippiensis]
MPTKYLQWEPNNVDSTLECHGTLGRCKILPKALWYPAPVAEGPAAAHREEAPAVSGDVPSGSPPVSAIVLRMCRLWQQWTQDWTLMLDRLVTVAEERLADSWAWCAEDPVCEQARVVHELKRDRADWAFQDRILAFEERHTTLLERMVEAQEQ